MTAKLWPRVIRFRGLLDGVLTCPALQRARSVAEEAEDPPTDALPEGAHRRWRPSLVNDRVCEFGTTVANVDPAAGDEFADLLLRPFAKRAA